MSGDHTECQNDASANSTAGQDRDSAVPEFSRRRFVAASAASWATVSLAGCSDSGDESPGTTTGTDTYTVTSDTTTTTSPMEAVTTAVGDTSTPASDDTPASTSTPTPTPTPTETTTATPTQVTTTECSSSDVFVPGMEIAFVVGVYDTETGEAMGRERLDAVSVEFQDENVEPLKLAWVGPHEEYVDDEWATTLETSPDMPTGRYRYEITVDEADGDENVSLTTDRFSLVRVEG